MEKKLGGKSYIFKEKLKMFEVQRLKKIYTDYSTQKIDEIELAFEFFGLFCTAIDGKVLTPDTAIDHIKNIDEISVFAEIQEAIKTVGEEMIKKMNMNPKKKVS